MSFRARSAAAASLASLAPGSMLSARYLKQGCSAKGCKVHSKTSLARSEEQTSELQSLMRNSYAVFCLKKKKNNQKQYTQGKSVLEKQTTSNKTQQRVQLEENRK